MATGGTITMIKQPTGLYPAYNDSFMIFEYEFESEYAEISVDPTSKFPKPFVIYPDADGIYRFNLKEVAKARFNEQGFEDNNVSEDLENYVFTDNYIQQVVYITVYSTTGGDGTDTKIYTFYKNLQQIGESLDNDSNYNILSPSEDNINYYIDYFEGFPFHFDIKNTVPGDTIKVLNKNTTQYLEFRPLAPNTTRFNVDVVNKNWTTENLLPLTDNLNKLEIYREEDFERNLYLRKKSIKNGILLKWFNNNGGYSFHLFDKYYKDEIVAKDYEVINSNQYLNVGEVFGDKITTGKQGIRTFDVKTRVDKYQSKIIEQLYTSPLVQMYTSQEAYVKGEFINVQVKGSYKKPTKKYNNEQSLKIELPELITARL